MLRSFGSQRFLLKWLNIVSCWFESKSSAYPSSAGRGLFLTGSVGFSRNRPMIFYVPAPVLSQLFCTLNEKITLINSKLLFLASGEIFDYFFVAEVCVAHLDNLTPKGAESSQANASSNGVDRDLLDLASPQSLKVVRGFTGGHAGESGGNPTGLNPNFLLVADTSSKASEKALKLQRSDSHGLGQNVSASPYAIPVLKLPHLDAAQLKKLALEVHGPASVTDWDVKHKDLVLKASKTDAKLQFFGDSITEYMKNDSKDNMDAFNRNFASLKPSNFGIAGDSTDGLFRRVNDGELGGHPKVISLMIGTNDIPTPKSADEIAQTIAKIVETIRLKEPESKVLIMGLLPRCSPTDSAREKFREKIARVNAEISQLSNGNTIRYLDISAKFEDSKGYARQDLLGDYLHPSHAGYEVWSDAVKPVIDSMSR
jgi:lysophospholipase L1-like esterase